MNLVTTSKNLHTYESIANSNKILFKINQENIKMINIKKHIFEKGKNYFRKRRK